MNCVSRVPRFVAVLALILALAGTMDLLAANVAQAQDNYKTATALGGASRFDQPLKDVKSVQKWIATKRAQAGLTTVMEKAGLAALTPTVIDILTKADPAQLKETDFQPGSTMVWMAFRRAGKPDVVRNIRWGGKQAFAGYTFIIDDMNQTYTFIVPKPCANLALVSSEPSREKARLDAEKAAKDKAEADRLAAEKAAAERARLEAERRERERLEAERLAKEKAAAAAAVVAKAAADKAVADQAEADRLAAEKKAKYDLFFSPLFGKERKTRELDATAPATGTVNSSLCAPIFGVKAGVEIKMSEKFKIVPAAGVAFNFEKGSYSAMFAEAEFNGYSANQKNYFGASAGIWDMFHGNSITPSIGVQFGSQIWENAKMDKLFFVAEGRMFMRMFGEGLSNNYMFWGGVRYVIR
jgi:hypothetical protein